VGGIVFRISTLCPFVASNFAFIFKINKRKSVKVFDGKYGRLFLNLNFNAWFSEIDWNPHFLEIK